MHFLIYKITNKIDGKFYIGSHKTKNLDDNYMGSGKYLKYAQNKYGIGNFDKQIMFMFETSEEMYLKEFELVNKEFIATENTYNLKIGGNGGWDYLNKSGLNNSTKTMEQMQKSGFIHAERLKSDLNYREMRRLKSSENFKRLHKENKFKYDNFKGKSHSVETKRKIGEKNSIHQLGENNSQFGTIWITNGIDNKKIKKDGFIPEGWNKGRKIKK
jgi:hypothetical protein